MHHKCKRLKAITKLNLGMCPIKSTFLIVILLLCWAHYLYCHICCFNYQIQPLTKLIVHILKKLVCRTRDLGFQSSMGDQPCVYCSPFKSPAEVIIKEQKKCKPMRLKKMKEETSSVHLSGFLENGKKMKLRKNTTEVGRYINHSICCTEPVRNGKG